MTRRNTGLIFHKWLGILCNGVWGGLSLGLFCLSPSNSRYQSLSMTGAPSSTCMHHTYIPGKASEVGSWILLSFHPLYMYISSLACTLVHLIPSSSPSGCTSIPRSWQGLVAFVIGGAGTKLDMWRAVWTAHAQHMIFEQCLKSVTKLQLTNIHIIYPLQKHCCWKPWISLYLILY